jgi:hypothetical protein
VIASDDASVAEKIRPKFEGDWTRLASFPPIKILEDYDFCFARGALRQRLLE